MATRQHKSQQAAISGPVKQQVIALRSAPLLLELPESELRTLAPKASWRTHFPGSCIVSHQDESELIYIIVSGFVKISRFENYPYPARPDGLPERRKNSRRQLIVALRGPGDIVGEVPSILETGMTTDVSALTTCQIVAIHCQEFLACIQSQPDFARAVTYKIARNRVQSEQQNDFHLL